MTPVRYTLDVIGKAVFNYDFQSLTKDDPVIKVSTDGKKDAPWHPLPVVCICIYICMCICICICICMLQVGRWELLTLCVEYGQSLSP